ncbi:MAG: primosomal protein N', partial [Lachnospiraceae bacterium]|nr:primosomal protein N' [Lachnospiraceae bacterium]
MKERGQVIESQMIELAYFIRENFGATMNDALRTVLPVKQAVRRVEKKTVVLAAGADVAGDALAQAVRRKHAAKERLLRELLRERELPWELITGKLAVSAATVQVLVREGIVQVKVQASYRNPIANMLKLSGEGEGAAAIGTATAFLSALNPGQRRIHDRIAADLAADIHKPYLVHGVTGSGKTEVYLSVIEEVVRAGRQVIMLIPEIALTYQTLSRFYQRFGERVSILNSRMSAGERYDQSLRAKNGEIDIMIGPRSALFTPFARLGLIILDEEHESSYKSEMPPKYHAREVAIERARLAGASVVLGSATPSLTSYERALRGEYELFALKERAVLGASMPKVSVVDLREELAAGNRSIYSYSLQEKMKERLSAKQQT